MAIKALDSRLYEPGSYITDDKRLLLVVHVRWVGNPPTRKRLVTAEDASTEKLIPLTDEELGEYRFQCRAEPLVTNQTTEPAAA